MVVAVAVVRMVKVTVDQIIEVIAVRDLLVPAIVAVYVGGGMSPTGVSWSAGDRIHFRHLEDVLVEVIVVLPVQAAIVQVVDVIAVTHGEVAASHSMNV